MSKKFSIVRLICLTLSFVLILSSLSLNNKVSAEFQSQVSNYEIFGSNFSENIDLESYLKEVEKEVLDGTGEKILFKVLEGNKIEIETTNSEGNPILLVIDTKTSELIVDGENLGQVVHKTVEVEEELLKRNQLVRGAYDPVYVATYNYDLQNLGGDLSKAAIYTTALIVVGVAILTGMGITVPAVLASVKAYLTSFGFSFATTLMGDMLGGKITYKLYKTKEAVPTGYGSYQTALRYQDGVVSAKFKIGIYTSPTWTFKGTTGSWWFSDKPM
ncbi:hypothetical protein [Psychrobacillus sp.]|uniref:hypothetical protein n=1 Tax=Psychrobacillus sp. TaxID=1871623 RepID=UPI0028BE9B8A|nr:hypothetical protein [Psychrobacillus sp.]